MENLLNIFNTRAKQAAVIVLVVGLGAITSAWGFEIIGGFKPCALCLTQRWAYYTAVPLAVILVALIISGKITDGLLRTGVAVLALVFLAGGILGAYHAGVEWGFWPGPSSCTGGSGITGGLPDLSQKVVQCDEVQIRILGLSFAGWNVIVSGFCVLVGLRGVIARKGF